MGFVTYADVLRIPTVRRIVILGMVVRVPLWAGNIALTLHVVTHLHGSYADAGFVAAVQAAALGISGPWRGRLLDRLGVRRAITPSLFVLAAAWSIAPWLGYWPLLGLAALAGLFTVPSFSIVRAVLIGAVAEDQRTTALSIDSVATELTFMVGPVLGVLAATALPTPIALFVCEMCSLAGAVLIWW
ncbi:MAG TPA: MFS transporter, partial [Gemmatimonadales bacterium]|nr:MFS transporter [Gemmatimonadales bacterium]